MSEKEEHATLSGRKMNDVAKVYRSNILDQKLLQLTQIIQCARL